MKKGNRKIAITKQYINIDDINTDQTLETLKKAWNNLPNDMSSSEREVFFEIAQNLVRLHQQLKAQTNKKNDLEKN